MFTQQIRQLGNWCRTHTGDAAVEESALARVRGESAKWKQRREESNLRVEQLEQRLASLEQRLAARDRDLEALRAKLAHSEAKRDAAQKACTELTARVHALHASTREARDAVNRLHRAIPSVDVVRGSLGLRRITALARAHAPEALARDARFRERSAAYVAAAACALDGAPDVAQTKLQGLTWWVPVLKPGQELPGSPWLQKQRFPYRTIAQTRELSVGGVMLDLGCNLGRMSISRAILGDVIAVYGAEPDPLNYACLVRNVVDNGLGGLVMPDHCAIGDHDGTAWLKRTRSSGGHHVERNGGEDLIEVPMYTVDSWVQRLDIDPRLITFVKVDVQGYEPFVIAGATETLKHRQIAWQMEISPSLLRNAGTEPCDLYARLAQHFSYFTDLNKDAVGPRRRPVAELADALAYIEAGHHDQTDVLLFNEG